MCKDVIKIVTVINYLLVPYYSSAKYIDRVNVIAIIRDNILRRIHSIRGIIIDVMNDEVRWQIIGSVQQIELKVSRNRRLRQHALS